MNKIKNKIESVFRISDILLLLGAGLVVRIILSNFGTLTLDQNTFIAWSNSLNINGFSEFYKGWADYLPGYLYVLWILAKIQNIVNIPQEILYKIPAIFADLATGFLIFKILIKKLSLKKSLFFVSLYIFNPAILGNSTLWGQVDSFIGFFSLLSVYMLMSGSWWISALTLAYATAVKPQAALVSLVILFVMYQKKFKPVDTVKYVIFSGIIFVLLFAPFNNGSNLILFVVDRITKTLDQYPYTSINAFNFWGLWGFWNQESAFSKIIGYAAPLVITCLTAWKLRNKKNDWKAIDLLSVVYFVSFLFITRLHERHLLPVFAPLVITAANNPLMLVVYAISSFVYALNLYYSWNWITNDFQKIVGQEIIIFSILSLIAAFVFLIISLLRSNKFNFSIEKLKDFRKVTPLVIKPENIKVKTAHALLFSIIVFAFVSRIFFLWAPEKEYFDEVYHAFTARIMLHSDPKAWEWWNPHPEGFAYEWTHPPVAKIGMVIGMSIFGENSFGWRFPGALLGTISVFLVYKIANEIFKSNKIALLSSFLYSLDGLPLVLSRIGMNDSYLICFILSSYYLFIKDKHFLSSVFLGLAAASKWSTLWFIPILVVSHFVLNKKLTKKYYFYVFIPLLVYLLSYTNFFTSGHSWEQFIGLQKQMWWYHTKLVATHPYSSLWWSWTILLRPIYLYVGSAGETVSKIYAMGNPIIFWAGLGAVFNIFWISLTEKNKKLGLIFFSYSAFFVPWAMSPRIMFLYHYAPSIPFLVIALAYVLTRNKKFIIPFLVFSIISYIYFYPHWTALAVPAWLDESYYWFPSWR